MSKKIFISKANSSVVKVIRESISAKKEKHEKLLSSINPSLIESLQKMKKIELVKK